MVFSTGLFYLHGASYVQSGRIVGAGDEVQTLLAVASLHKNEKFSVSGFSGVSVSGVQK